MCEPMGFGGDFGVDLRLCSVAVFEDVVLVVQFGEPFGQGQLVPEPLVDSEGQPAWRQLTGQHPDGKGPYDSFLSGNTAHWVEREA